MNQPTRQFSVVDEPEGEGPTNPVQHDAAAAMMALALRALSNRAITAIASLFTLLTVASAFWLALQIAVSPTPYQLTCFALYLAFVVGINVIVRR